ncbi:hypothetical protein Adt_05142 [Abeliophyllum distichum]|uniref:Uncharacterized protein n=1 Tax=Abeliophyllum distichum TaxID=126358 RepID=A0ABD1V392_9LAMI
MISSKLVLHETSLTHQVPLPQGLGTHQVPLPQELGNHQVPLPQGLGTHQVPLPQGLGTHRVPLPQGLGTHQVPLPQGLGSQPSVTQCYSARMQRDPRSSNLRRTRSGTHINVRPEPCGTYFTVFQIFYDGQAKSSISHQ